MAKITVQSIVRSVDVGWQKGTSVCYSDTSYTKTRKKRRLKFDNMATLFGEMRSTSPEYEAREKMLHKRLVDGLAAAGFVIEPTNIHVYPGVVLIYEEWPITIVEG